MAAGAAPNSQSGSAVESRCRADRACAVRSSGAARRLGLRRRRHRDAAICAVDRCRRMWSQSCSWIARFLSRIWPLPGKHAGDVGCDRACEDPTCDDQACGQPVLPAAWIECIFLAEACGGLQQIEDVRQWVEFWGLSAVKRGRIVGDERGGADDQQCARPRRTLRGIGRPDAADPADDAHRGGDVAVPPNGPVRRLPDLSRAAGD
jgi:hypothetical protein